MIWIWSSVLCFWASNEWLDSGDTDPDQRLGPDWEMFKYSDKIFQLRDIQTIFLNPSIPQSNLLPCWGEIVFGGRVDNRVEWNISEDRWSWHGRWKGADFQQYQYRYVCFLSLKMGGFSCNLTPFDQMWPFRCFQPIWFSNFEKNYKVDFHTVYR